MMPPAAQAVIHVDSHEHGPPPMRVRPLRPDDGPALEKLARLCDPEDLRLRFFHVVGEGHRILLERLTRLEPSREEAHVAFDPGGGIPIGVVRLHGEPDGETAEFALLVRSDHKGHGVGRALMELIIGKAMARGLASIWGPILPENSRMLALVRHLGFTTRSTPEGVVEARLDLRAGAQSE